MNRRNVSDEQLRRFEGYASEIFTAFGMDLETPSTAETPRRFIKLREEFFTACGLRR
ncbi:MAG: hypothetical protein WCW52_04465 [Elusimicrobiales bacterium]